ncbi:MAG TPA: branched-chain amino acid ABC transporter permease [Acidiphilium sp.]|uniref:branched-chain amino acid ABC transporter permease n=1 Tax=unclassified Acidiphilium TaxID=2617493 RepID=UPI000BD1897E|nr:MULTISPECIES: branched-chain amino acid ABC transporter permease [unclassified Acidiphilium]OYV55856.1 MAG: branched-chain amino acid ABC transporter permease [Acidiphilium sp. 20-67-58]OYV85522.1 MAG: branched-chain amino acid ABC transporter permease [Acidiphilium sp. 21-68-69]HQT60344.1 branched-chain amino acid ABC transporter permease [Acidiphilium sp.]HQU11663.1 branched-chain amino acid ABC transporter permease [Acidiphilium sp.]
MFGFTRAQAIGFVVMAAILAVAPFVVYPIFVMQVMCFALFAMGANLLMGYTGLLSLGQAAFFGMGGYVVGYMIQTMHASTEVGLILGGLTAAAIGVVFGWLAIRRQTIYFAMITLALAQLVYFFAVQDTSFTGGENGIQNIPRGNLFGSLPLHNDLQLYWLVFGVFIAGFLFVHRVIHSPFGQVVKAIRENESRAISLGYKVEQYKWVIFVLSAALGGIAGGLNALVVRIATLTDVGNATSGLVVLMVLVGGIGTVFGPLVGAAIIVAMQYYLASFSDWVTVIQGVIFIACVLAFRRGVAGEVASWLKLSL